MSAHNFVQPRGRSDEFFMHILHDMLRFYVQIYKNIFIDSSHDTFMNVEFVFCLQNSGHDQS